MIKKKQSTIVLDYDERRANFEDYDLILCEKCKHKIENKLSSRYCKDCYEKETGNAEKNRMTFGRCKECFQDDTNDSCIHCARKHFQQDFDKWTSGNKSIDKLIQDSQLSANRIFNALEWIPSSANGHPRFAQCPL